MSEFETTRNTSTMVIAIVVIAIIGVAGVSIMLMASGPGTGPTNSTETTTDTTPTGNVLTILTRHDISIQGVFESKFLQTPFAQQNDIVDLKWRSPNDEYWDDLINQGIIDACWGGGPTLFDQLMRTNLLEPLTSTKMQTVADRINDTIAGVDMKRNNTSDELVWIAAAISTFGFTVNHEFLDTYSLPVPNTWNDLAEPVWASQLPTIPTLAMGNAPYTTSNTRIYEIMTQALGWEEGWINMARMAGSAEIYGGSVETQNAVENGDVGVAMSIDFYGYLTQSRNPDCEYIVPEGQSIVNGDPIAIPNTSTQKDLAEGFLDYILSAEGQANWLNNDLRRMPVMREAFDEPGVSGVEDLYTSYNQTTATVGIDFNDTMSLSMNRAFIKYFESVFTHAHTELANCWEAIYRAWDEGRITIGELNTYADQMGALISIVDPKTSVTMQFTPAYAEAMNSDMISDSTYASTVQTRWTTEAKIQYISVMNAANAET
ncbi:MAG: ABC transporter substrate-binding protein [Candidatus Thorarchaeota archaeon]